MEVLLAIAAIWLLFMVGGRIHRALWPDSPRPSQAVPSPPAQPIRKHTYRPQASTSSAKSPIVFPNSEHFAKGAAVLQDLQGLHDAFTGAALDPALGLHHCTHCKVHYHAGSVSVLRQENGGRCVACGANSITTVAPANTARSAGRDYRPDSVTLDNYRRHFGRVVTFEGKVRSIKVSRRGEDYAVMFENIPWSRGFKLVFFRGSIDSVGGPQFIFSLDKRHVRVRGLLVDHPIFGPQIIVSERGMILEIG